MITISNGREHLDLTVKRVGDKFVVGFKDVDDSMCQIWEAKTLEEAMRFVKGWFEPDFMD